MTATLDLPSAEEVRSAFRVFEPWRRLVQPKVTGLEHLPAEGAALLVGNHAIGGFDALLLVSEILRGTGRAPSGLGDRVQFSIPGWRSVITRLGAVEGTRENATTLLKMGQMVIVFPGGGREVNKRRGERYQLIWKERLGFARMAVAAGCPIVPFSAVGGDDALDVVLDADSKVFAPLRAVVSRLTPRDDALPSIVRGIGLTPIPREERYYFRFAEPIDTARWAGRENDRDALREVRDEVKAAIEGGVADLLAEREHDPDRALRRRVLKGLRGEGAGA